MLKKMPLSTCVTGRMENEYVLKEIQITHFLTPLHLVLHLQVPNKLRNVVRVQHLYAGSPVTFAQ
jgi:hypothetical protein